MAKRTSAAKMEDVNDLQSEPAVSKEMDLAGGLAFVTFLALLVAFVAGQMALDKYFAYGMFAK
jgi:hypothetical protein